MFSNAPLGANLESACKAYAHREAERKEREKWDAIEERMIQQMENIRLRFEETGEGWY